MLKKKFGFTLLEIMIVLLILGGIAALVIPNFTRFYDTLVYRTTLDELLSAARDASTYAYLSGESLDLVMFIESRVDLKNGWTVYVDNEITVSASGVCEGGVLHIVSPRKTENFELIPPFCTVE